MHGTAMGSPVSVVVANLVMEDVEERALESFPSPPRFWKHYVDDTFTALPKTLITPFLEHLNGIEPSIKFTVEEERDGQLAFLDVLLRREDDSTISTSCLLQGHPHQPVPVLMVTPSNSTQSSSCQNSDDQSREFVFLGCEADRRREACHRCTERQ